MSKNDKPVSFETLAGFLQKPRLTEEHEAYLKAVEAGDATVWGELGYDYLYGMGAERDFDKALECFHKGAELDDPEACFGIVELYESCKPIDPQAKKESEQEAVKMCARAMLLGHKEAPYALSRMDSEWKIYATAYCKENGIGYEQDIPEAVRLYEQDAESGGYHSRMRLDEIYKHGIANISTNEEKAARSY
jgi:TPR repeat protein